MTKTDTKKAPEKTDTAFQDLVKASERKTDTVELDDFTVVVREFGGRERFEAGKMAEELGQWEVVLWLCFNGMVDPKADSMDDLDALKPEWLQKIAAAIMKLSGMTLDEKQDAEKESAAVIDIGGS